MLSNSSITADSSTLQYAYDGEGNRVRKELAGGAETHYVRGAGGEVLAVYESGSLQFHNILAGADIIGTWDGTQRRYFLKDHLGSVRTTVDQSGNVDGYDDYYPFGLTMPGRSSNSANPNDNYKFTGYEHDDEAGLTMYHANARGYDPVLGRFMQIDPRYELYPGWTTYQYGLNNPLRYTDPTGECIKELPCPKFIENLKNKAVQVDFSGKLSGGFQFSANVERFEGFTANAGSIELANFEGSTELSLTDEGIQAENTEISGEIKGKGDDVVVSQEAGFSLHGVGGSVSHDFSFNKDGITSQQISGSVGAGPLNVTQTENLQTGKKTETTTLELGVKGAFILGIELNVSIKIDERDL